MKNNFINRFLVVSFLVFNSCFAHSEEPEAGLLGNWAGAKSSLKEKGIDLALVYKGDSVTNFDGGTKRKSVFLGNVDATIDFDLEKLISAKGLSFFVYGLGNHGDHPSEYMGDSFVSSSIEAPNTFKVYELYLKQAVDEHFNILFGLKDLNADYYVAESAKPLLNSAFGISPSLSQTGVNGPSIFPVTAPALAVQYKSPNGFYFQTAAFNATAGNPKNPKGTYIPSKLENGLLSIWESGYGPEKENGVAKYSVGIWQYSKKIDSVDSTFEPADNSGYYLIVDQSLSKNISVFARYGTAAKRVNEFSSATEFGLSFTGPFKSRPDDKLIVGVAQAQASKDYVNVNSSQRSESVYEIAYKADIISGISLTPDYQQIINPGLIKGSKEIQVGSLRIEIEF